MTNLTSSLAHFSDQQLIAEVKRLAVLQRQSTADLIRSLMELDARRLYLGEGCSSLFTYCTQVLRLSDMPPTDASRRRVPPGDSRASLIYSRKAPSRSRR